MHSLCSRQAAIPRRSRLLALAARLPGIGVQRDQGQERYIQIRGAPTRWTAVALDGVNVLGAEDRIFRFDSVPAAQVSQVVLNKTPVAVHYVRVGGPNTYKTCGDPRNVTVALHVTF